MHRKNILRVIRGGLHNTRIYRGHVSGARQRVIVARSANEAYALMLDSLAGGRYDSNEVFADPETDESLLARYKHAPVGVYMLNTTFTKDKKGDNECTFATLLTEDSQSVYIREIKKTS